MQYFLAKKLQLEKFQASIWSEAEQSAVFSLQEILNKYLVLKIHKV